MSFKDYIKELLETVSDIDGQVSGVSPDQSRNLRNCGTNVVLSALIQALKLKEFVLDKVLHVPGQCNVSADSKSHLHSTEAAESRRKLAAVKKRLFSLDKLSKETYNNEENSSFGKGPENGDLNASADVFSDSVAHHQNQAGNSALTVEDVDCDSDATVDNDINNSAGESHKASTSAFESPKLFDHSGCSSGSTSTGKKKDKFTPVKHNTDNTHVKTLTFGNKPVTDKVKLEEERDSDDTDDLENFDDFNLDDMSSSTPAVKLTTQKRSPSDERAHSSKVWIVALIRENKESVVRTFYPNILFLSFTHVSH